jgi:TolA-binding protein
VHGYPESAYVTRVLTKAADQQLANGRPDLARATLEYLATRYPDDALAQVAKQRLLAGR